MNVSAASLAPDLSVRKATPSDITERTVRSGAVVETIFLSRPLRAQCIQWSAAYVIPSVEQFPRRYETAKVCMALGLQQNSMTIPLITDHPPYVTASAWHKGWSIRGGHCIY